MSALGFNGRMGREVYGRCTLLFIALVWGLATRETGSPLTLVLTAPWAVLGHALDSWIQIGGPGASVADTLVSAVVGVTLIWVFSMMNVRRLRDIGQSPWWIVLLIMSGVVVPAMIVLSLIRSRPSGEATAGGGSAHRCWWRRSG